MHRVYEQRQALYLDHFEQSLQALEEIAGKSLIGVARDWQGEGSIGFSATPTIRICLRFSDACNLLSC